MSPDQETQLREQARKVAAEAPQFTDELRQRLAHLLRPAPQGPVARTTERAA